MVVVRIPKFPDRGEVNRLCTPLSNKERVDLWRSRYSRTLDLSEEELLKRQLEGEEARRWVFRGIAA